MSKKNENPFVSENPFLTEFKPKRHLWGLWFPLIIIGCVIIIPLCLVLFIGFDGTHHDVGVNSAIDGNQLVENIYADLFKDCNPQDDNSKIQLSVSQNHLNQFFYGLNNQIGRDYVKQIDIRILEDKYIFEAEVGAFGFLKSYGYVEATLQADQMIGNERAFVFNLQNVTVGRLSGLREMIPWILDVAKFDLQAELTKAKLSMKVDLPNYRITYLYSDFVKDLGNLGMGDGLFIDLFSNFFSGGYVHFNHVANEGIYGNIPLTDFAHNDQYIDHNMTIEYIDEDGEHYPLLKVKAQAVMEMMRNGILNKDVVSRYLDSYAKGCYAVHKFICYGQDFLDVNELGLMYYLYNNNPSFATTYLRGKSIPDYSSYMKQLVFGDTASSLVDRLNAQAQAKVTQLLGGPTATEAEKAIKINEIKDKLVHDGSFYLYGSDDRLNIFDKDIHDVLKANSSMITTGYPFAVTSDGNPVYSFAMVDNAYSVLKGNPLDPDAGEFTLVYGLNINGYETSIILSCQRVKNVVNPSSTCFILKFSTVGSHMYYGSVQMDNLLKQLADIMAKIGQGANSWISYKDNEFTVKIDLTELTNTGDFAKVHSRLTGTGPYDGNADLVVRFFVETNSNSGAHPFDPAIYGNGRISTEVGYVVRN